MKKILIYLFILFISFNAYSQTHTPFNIKIRIKNTPHCSIQLRGLYYTSASIIPNSFGLSNFIPSNYFTGDSAVLIIPYDTTTTFNLAVITDSGCPCKSINGGTYINAYHTSVVNINFCDSFPMGIEFIPTNPKKVIRIVDEMGRETQPEPNKILIYFYSDGTNERKVTLKMD